MVITCYVDETCFTFLFHTGKISVGRARETEYQVDVALYRLFCFLKLLPMVGKGLIVSISEV